MSGKALFDFVGQAANQLSFRKGDAIKIISAGPAGGWSKGEAASGRSGFYPTDYVSLLSKTHIYICIHTYIYTAT